MNIIEIIILGMVQGIAEFLPISSSAHLIIFRDIFGIGQSIPTNIELTFDIALHLGTLLAIGIFFFKDFVNMIIKGFTKGVKDSEGKLLWYIIIATIPAAIMGVLFEDKIELLVRKNYLLIAIALIVMGIILYLADKYSKQKKDIKQISITDALIIGFSQIFALIPGFSRSGTTIATSRILKLDRYTAAKFSFFLSAPIILGAVILQILKKNIISIVVANMLPFIVGVLTSFIIGMLCIKYLLKYLKNHDFKIFMIYRIAIAIIVIIKILL